MFNQIRTQKLNSIVWLLALTILVFVSPFVQLLPKLTTEPITLKHPIVYFISTMLVVFGGGLLVNNICNRTSFLGVASNLPVALTILLGSELIYFSYAELLTFVIMIFIFNKLIKSYFKESAIVNYFDTAMLIGTLSVIHLPSALLLVALWAAIPVLSELMWSKVLLTIVGFLFVWLFCFTFLFVTDSLQWFSIQTFLAKKNILQFSQEEIAPLHYFVAVLGILSVLYFIGKKRFLRGVQAPYLWLATIFMVFALVISILFLGSVYEAICLAIVPLVIVTSYYYFNINRKLANLLFYMLIGTIIVLQWLTPIY